MESLQIIFLFAVNAFLLAVMPGPDNIVVATQSIAYGKKHGYFVVLGLVTGCLFHTLFVALGISLLIKNNPIVYTLLIIAGASYLFYLAYQLYRTELKFDFELVKSNIPKLKSMYVQGITMNLLNPKVSLFFIAFFPTFLFSDHFSLPVQFITLGLLFSAITFIVFSSISFFAVSLKRLILTSEKSSVWVKWSQISIFMLLGSYILISHFYTYL